MTKKTERMPVTYVKHRGVFSHQQLVKGIQHWFGENKYTFHAGKYKVKPNEAEYEVTGERKVNEYVKFELSVRIWIRDMSEVEVVQDGEKRKMNEGAVQVEVTGSYDLDYAERFGGSKFMQWLQDFYHKYVIRQTIEEVWEDDLYVKIVQLSNTIKEALGMET